MATDFGTVTVGMDDCTSGAGDGAPMAVPFVPFQPVIGGGGGDGARAPWILKDGKWTNAYVLVGSHIVDLGQPSAVNGNNYVKVTLGKTPAEDTAGIVGYYDGSLCFLVGTVQDDKQVSGIYTIPVVLTWE